MSSHLLLGLPGDFVLLENSNAVQKNNYDKNWQVQLYSCFLQAKC